MYACVCVPFSLADYFITVQDSFAAQLSQGPFVSFHTQPNHINRIAIFFYVINREIQGRGKYSNEI